MDRAKAASLARRLVDNKLGEFTVKSLLDHGKSAAVFRANDAENNPVVIKVFDAEIVEQYGDETQLIRINRELELIGHSCPNLVQIVGGGYDEQEKLHYVAMEYLSGFTLKKALTEIPSENIRSLVKQLAVAAKFLEDRGICHRDIKPENIIISDDFKILTLLDLGVLRPIGKSTITDERTPPFIGTLQYSSPEFLLRQEVDSVEGWRAVTFYQIGAVMHDLIMRRQIFEQFAHPYAKLVNAIQYEMPVIVSDTIPRDLVSLATSCLVKPPALRVQLVTWDDFLQEPDEKNQDAKLEVARTLAIMRAAEEAPSATDKIKVAAFRNSIVDFLKSSATSMRSEGLLPPIVQHRDGDKLRLSFSQSLQYGIQRDFDICVAINILDAASRAVSISGFYCVPSALPVEPGANIFEGIYDTNAVYKAYEGFIYKVVGYALAGRSPPQSYVASVPDVRLNNG